MPVVARVRHPNLSIEETFKSKVDAQHWRRMVEETLDRPESRALDLPTYAHGLAVSVRTYGGPQTRDAWLRADAPANMWARGMVFGMKQLEDQVKAVLAGKPIEK